MPDGMNLPPLGDDTGLKARPHNLDAEQALLGALLLDNDVWQEVGDWLRPEHFYDPVHGRIYDAIAVRCGRGSQADAIVLKNDFERDGGIEEIGGTAYLATLLESAADSASAVEYGKLVFDLSRRRELIRIGEQMIAAADEAGPDIHSGSLIEGAEARLFALAETSGGRKAVTFAAALAQTLEMAAAAYQSEGGLSGLSSSLKALDRKLGGLHPSDLIILAGRPSMGKTALATNIAFQAARAGKPVGFFSLEMSAEQLSTRILSDYTGIPSHIIRRGEITADQFEEIRDATLQLQSAPLYIDDTGGLMIHSLCASARRMKRLYGLELLVVDYLQLAHAQTRDRNANRTAEVSEITMALKALAKELKIPVLALSQLSRQVEQRPDKRPQLSDLRESGSIEQDADVVMFVYREAYYKEREKPDPGGADYLAWQDEFDAIKHKAEIIIGKQRHGPIGTVDVHFDGARTRFSDIDTRHEP
jgi:replicative DNA helicase